MLYLFIFYFYFYIHFACYHCCSIWDIVVSPLLLLFSQECYAGFNFNSKADINQVQGSVFCSLVWFSNFVHVRECDNVEAFKFFFFFCLNLVFCGGFDLSKLDANWLRRVFLGCTI